MPKTREEYSEKLESQYRSMERSFNKIMIDFEGKNFSKSSMEQLDEVNNFFKICYHLREWVKKDNKVNKAIKDKLPTFEKNDSSVQFLICRDLCNKSKHSVLDKDLRYKPNDINTKIVPYGDSLFKVSLKDLGEANKKKETLHIKEEEGVFMGNYYVEFKNNRYDLRGVIQGCMHVWKEFFEKNDLLLPRSTPIK